MKPDLLVICRTSASCFQAPRPHRRMSRMGGMWHAVGTEWPSV